MTNPPATKAASVKLFKTQDFAFHKVKVVFWQTDAQDQPATLTEPYEKAFTAANLKKEQEFHDSDITFRVRVKVDGEEQVVTIDLKPEDSATKKLKTALGQTANHWPELVSVEWTHRHYVADDEYIPWGEEIAAFLSREIARLAIQCPCQLCGQREFLKEIFTSIWARCCNRYKVRMQRPKNFTFDLPTCIGMELICQT